MIYTEEQLGRFSKPPFKYERKQIIATHKEIRAAIDKYYDRRYIQNTYGLASLPEVEHFLQGSYSNDTNITQSSDVDIVVLLRNVWRSDTSKLSADEVDRYKQVTAASGYSFQQFKSDILGCITRHFGAFHVVNDEKCIRLKHPDFCDADIVPSLLYRRYDSFASEEKQKFVEGIGFNTNSNVQIVNYPKLHADMLIQKSAATDGNFKETVRMFKNFRNELADQRLIAADTIKSYYLENMLFNVNNDHFKGNYTDRFLLILSSLVNDYNNKSMPGYVCANGITKLFSDTSWSLPSARTFLEALITIRDNKNYNR